MTVTEDAGRRLAALGVDAAAGDLVSRSPIEVVATIDRRIGARSLPSGRLADSATLRRWPSDSSRSLTSADWRRADSAGLGTDGSTVGRTVAPGAGGSPAPGTTTAGTSPG